MIDVHILKSGRGFFDKCIESINSKHVNIHVLEHSDSNYGKARIDGFSCGSAPYVAAIDDDDIVISGVFERAIHALKNDDCSAYYSNHHIMDEDENVYGQWFSQLANGRGFSQAKQMHHVVVYKRKVIEPVLQYLDGIKIQDKKLLNLASISSGKVVGDLYKGLFWRVHSTGVHKKFSPRDNPDKWKEQVALYEKRILKWKN